MAPQNVPPLEVPLHRLLKRQQAAIYSSAATTRSAPA